MGASVETQRHSAKSDRRLARHFYSLLTFRSPRFAFTQPTNRGRYWKWAGAISAGWQLQ